MKNLVRRIAGYFIDLVISFVFYLLFFSLAGLILKLIGVNKVLNSGLHKYLNSINQVEDQFYTFLAFFLFLMLQDTLLKNNAISRRIVKLRLTDAKSETYPGFKKLVIRNFVKSLLIVDLVYFIFTRKIAHDRLSSSVVLKK